jgi:hypothetical protein
LRTQAGRGIIGTEVISLCETSDWHSLCSR